MISSNTVQFGVITDEISQNFEMACQVAQELGMQYVELHGLWDKQVVELTDDEVAQAKATLKRHGLKVHLICGMLFRPFSLADIDVETMIAHPRFQEHMQALERYIQLAKAFDAPYIRTFGFTRDAGGGNPSPRYPDGGGMTDETLAKIAQAIRFACERVAPEDLTLALENARSQHANTGGNMRRVLDAVQQPNLKIIWDPANAFVAGEDPALGFQAVQGNIVDVHCKDATVVDAETDLTAWTRIGDGSTNWSQQLELLRDEPVTAYTIETHWKVEGQDRADNTRQTFASLKALVEGIY